jgi:excinuclease ABC subunit C
MIIKGGKDGYAKMKKSMKTFWQKKLESLPTQSGVYIFRNKNKEPIYVGKAVSLRARVRNYFADPVTLAPRTRAMVENAVDLDYIVTGSELEALILESNLIKQYRPKYNVRIKDDKRYPWLKFTYGDDFPRLTVVRVPRKDGHRYFGPFPKAYSMRQTLKLIHSIFRLRACKLEIHEGLKACPRPCLEYDMKRCDAPCVGLVSREDYRKMCDHISLFLQGRMEDVIHSLQAKMETLSAEMRFEEAAAVRDQISAVRDIQEKQTIYTPDMADRDILGTQAYEDTAVVTVFVTRRGKLIGREKYRLDGTEETEPGEILSVFIRQHYTQPDMVPHEIWMPVEIPDAQSLSEWLSGMKGRKVELLVPKIGDKRRMVQMAEENAQFHLQQELVKKNPALGKMPQGLFELQSVLGLEKLPQRMEAYDISNISGTDSVGSMVVFKNGYPSKSDYRKFKIKTVEGINDFASMKEIVSRRMKYLLPDQKGLPESRGMDQCPDIVLIDGGAGQLHAALEGIRETLGKDKSLPFFIFGLAKRWEEIILPGGKEPILLPLESKALHLLQSIRDEAHRFAITYHRHLRGKKLSGSVLDELAGIGEKRKLMLLRRYGSVEELKSASLAELKDIPGLGEKLAEELYEFLQKL